MAEINFFIDLELNVKQSLIEDIREGDLTANLIPATTMTSAKIIAKETAVVCGRPWFDAVFNNVDDSIKINWLVDEGQRVAKNTIVCELVGKANSLLTAERSALNFLQTLSATATTTALYVEQLRDSKTQLLDTRKTLPNLRLAQKYAVKGGGGKNHRVGLYDAILIKENHIMAAGGIAKAVSTAKNNHPNIQVEVETENLDELQQALDTNADIIMLDNFTTELIMQAVQINKQHINKAKLEVSGNIELKDLAGLAKTGVDFISTGAITKNIHTIDYSMRFNLEI